MKEVKAAIITIGDELLIGQTIDTNSAFIAQELNKLGIWVSRRIAVGDVKEEILECLEKESSRCDLLIITGGLGPTADDITKPALCEYFNASLVVDAMALENVHRIFTRLNKPVSERNRMQAEVPDNCRVLQNARGTAPGMWFEKNGVVYVSLPGVPNEMKGLLTDAVVPALQKHFQLSAIVHRTALLAGKGESEVAELLFGFESSLPPHVKLAYLPAFGMLRLRLTARGEDRLLLEAETEQLFADMNEQVRDYLVATEDTSLQQVVIELLKASGKKLAIAESCTGGYIAHLITSIAGSSAVFNGGVVAYANEVKEAVLNVPAATLQQFGAVSEQTVGAMARGVLEQLGADYAVATSGIMGPGGGSLEKPVGLVWIAVAGRSAARAFQINYPFDRNRNIQYTATTALNLLRRFIVEQEAQQKWD